MSNDPLQVAQESQGPLAPTPGIQTPTIDYGALAKQAGAVRSLPAGASAPANAAPANAAPAPAAPAGSVDYNALAQQAGAVHSEPSGNAGESGVANWLRTGKYGIESQEQNLADKWNGGNPIGGALGSLTIGAEKGLVNTVWDIGGLTQKAWNAMTPENSAIHQFDDSSPDFLKAHGVLENVGQGGEQIAEFLLGDAAVKGVIKGVKGLSVAQKLAKAAKEMELIEGNPKLATVVRLGLGAMRMGAVQAGLSKVHGASNEEALRSGAMTGALGGGLEALGAAAKAPEQLADAFKYAPTPSNVRLTSGLASTARGLFGAGVGAYNAFDALVEQQEGETPDQADTRRGQAAVGAALGFMAMKDALTEGPTDMKAAGYRAGEIPGERDIERARFPISSKREVRDRFLNAWEHTVPYAAREAQTLPKDSETALKWNSGFNPLNEKYGQIAQAADLLTKTKTRLREGQIEPVEKELADHEGDTSPVAAAIRNSFTDLDRDTEVGQSRIKAADTWAKKFEGQMSVKQMADYVEALNNEPSVSTFYAMDDAGKAEALNGDPLIRQKILAGDELRKVLFETVGKGGGERVQKAYQEARADYGYMSEVRHMLQSGNIKSLTRIGLLEKMANTFRFFVYPKSVFHAETLGSLRNPDRLVASAFEDAAKYGKPAADNVRPTIQTSMLDVNGPDFGVNRYSVTPGVGPQPLGGEQVGKARPKPNPETIHAYLTDALSKNTTVRLSPEQWEAYHDKYGVPPNWIVNAGEKGQINLHPVPNDMVPAHPGDQSALFGQQGTERTPMEYSDAELAKISAALKPWTDILNDETAKSADKVRALDAIQKGILPSDTAASPDETTKRQASKSIYEEHLPAMKETQRALDDARKLLEKEIETHGPNTMRGNTLQKTVRHLEKQQTEHSSGMQQSLDRLETPKFSTDSNGIRWAQVGETKISIPKRILEPDLMDYVKGKLDEQAAAQQAIKEGIKKGNSGKK